MTTEISIAIFLTILQEYADLLKGLTVVDDCNHVLNIALRILTVFKMIFFIQLCFIFVPVTHTRNGIKQIQICNNSNTPIGPNAP